MRALISFISPVLPSSPLHISDIESARHTISGLQYSHRPADRVWQSVIIDLSSLRPVVENFQVSGGSGRRLGNLCIELTAQRVRRTYGVLTLLGVVNCITPRMKKHRSTWLFSVNQIAERGEGWHKDRGVAVIDSPAVSRTQLDRDIVACKKRFVTSASTRGNVSAPHRTIQ